ncbi:hypothetical protein ACFQVA_32955 [Actinomadura keratinilytica]
MELRPDIAEAVVQGNGVLLERIALNLTQNAVRYNLPPARAAGWRSPPSSSTGRRCWS